MSAPVFVDTNVLVYREDSSDPAKQSRAASWIGHLAHRRSARISIQVLQELYATLTRKVTPVFEADEARSIVRDLAVWQPVAINMPIMERAWQLQERHRMSWWDALILGAAQASNCTVLLTEDLQHGQMIDRVRIIDPFASPDRTPQQILASLPARKPG